LFENLEAIVGSIVELDWLPLSLAKHDELEGHWPFGPERIQLGNQTLGTSMGEFVETGECSGDGIGVALRRRIGVPEIVARDE
jgi:hypothetical protein